MAQESKPDPIGPRSGHNAINKEAERALTEYVSRFTLALYFPGRNDQYRSGIYCALDKHHFVVTASHELHEAQVKDVDGISRARQVLEKDPYPKERPWSKDKRPGERFKLLVQSFRLTPEDPLDLLVMDVDPLPRCEGWLEPYDLANAVTTVPTTSEPVLGIGYPVEHAKMRQAGPNVVELRASLLTHGTFIREPSPRPDNYDPLYHFLMMHNDKKRIHPRGMSGGPIWKIPSTEVTIWSPTGAQLVGVQSSYYTRLELLKATKVEHVIRLARELIGSSPSSA